MLETLSKGFRNAKQKLGGLTEITEKNIDEVLRDIRLSLLEADVDYKLTKRFLAAVKEKALGEVVQLKVKAKGKKLKVKPHDHFIAICQKELENMMGPVQTRIDLAPKGTPTGIMLAGLQGSGKTTTAAKLARLLEKQDHKPLLVAADIYRPAAVDQLKVLGERLDIPVFSGPEGMKPVDICTEAMRHARLNRNDMVLFDTAGRLAIDEPLMHELGEIKKKVKPKNIFLVCDAMIGQDAVNTASAFHEKLGISGVILTKLDGDARGGAALSIKEVTGTPIKFIGMGEGLDKLEEFRPEGLAGRILGFGDVVGLMKDFEDVVDEKEAEQDAVRMLKGQFSLDDFVNQIRTIKKMGSLSDLMEKMPFFPDGMPEGMNVDDGELVKIESMVMSMTRAERMNPSIIKKMPNRIARVAKGSGRNEKDVTELITKFEWMRDMLGNIGNQAGLLGKIPGMKQMAMAKKLKGAIGGAGEGDPLGNITNEMLEAAVASGQGGGGPRKYRQNAADRKKKRKKQRKARKKSRNR